MSVQYALSGKMLRLDYGFPSTSACSLVAGYNQNGAEPRGSPILIVCLLHSPVDLELGCPKPRLTRAGVETLQAYDWPGNIRELRNVTQHLDFPDGKDGIGAARLKEHGLAARQSSRVDALGCDGPETPKPGRVVGPARNPARPKNAIQVRSSHLADRKSVNPKSRTGIHSTLFHA